MQSTRAIAILLMTIGGAGAFAGDSFSRQRDAMLLEIADMAAATSVYLGKDRLDSRVMQALSRVPRHEFVPEALRGQGYANRPLPIGYGQTISQPYIVALMTDLAGVDGDSVVLEIGTGSGYQAAVLAEMVRHVYSIEIVEELGRAAERTLHRLGYANVTVRIGNGYEGWPEHAPYDAILVTAAPASLPAALLDQLKPGGKMIIPVGARDAAQSLQVISRDADGKVSTRDVLPVGFVPMQQGD